jgi:cyclophilin family peptidyl-prolyl cis-trans isomerase
MRFSTFLQRWVRFATQNSTRTTARRTRLSLHRLEDREVPAFVGGLFVASGDVNGDGTQDIVTAVANGGAPEIKVFNGADQSLLRSFFAFDSSQRGGATVAVADLTGDGKGDIIVGAGVGQGSRVRIFSGATFAQLTEFTGIEDSKFSGGVSVAAGDVNGDGTADVIVGAGTGGGPRVAIFDGTSLRSGTTPVKTIGDFFGLSSALRGGINVAAGDLDEDGRADIYIGSSGTDTAEIRVVSGSDRSTLRGFQAFSGAKTGVFVAAGDVNGDGASDMILSAGPGGGPQVQVFDGVTGTQLRNFFAYDTSFRGGATVAVGTFNGVANVINGPGSNGGANIKVTNATTGTSTASFFAYDAPTTSPPTSPPATNNAPTLRTPVANVNVAQNANPTTLDLSQNFADSDISNSVVRFKTTEGDIDIQLLDQEAPLTVNNFLNYIQRGAYSQSFFHRLVPGFVLQGGGFTFTENPNTVSSIATDAPVLNEPGRSNTRGTVAMAKLGGDPNSATNQFFFNLGDNSANLDNQNGGFTVFGTVGESAQAVIDRLAQYQRVNAASANSALTDLPTTDYAPASVPGVGGQLPVASNFPDDATSKNLAFVTGVDIINRSDQLTFSVVSNSNPSLVSPNVAGNDLRLNYSAGQSGTATITIRATDRAGASVDTTFTITVA